MHQKPDTYMNGLIDVSSSTTMYSDSEVPVSELMESESFEKDHRTNASQLVTSASPAFVFRRHLKLAKKEDSVLGKLHTKSSSRSPNSAKQIELSNAYENVDAESNTQLLNAASILQSFGDNRTPAEASHAHLTKTISLEDVIAQPMLSHEGKVLICVNAAFPVLSFVNGTYFLNTVIEDMSSKYVASLEVVCEEHDAELFAHFLKYPYLHGMELRSVIMIHNPMCKSDSSGETFYICVKDSRDATFLGHTIFLSLGSDKTTHSDNDPIGIRNGSEAKLEKNAEEINDCQIKSPLCEEKYARDEWKELGSEFSVKRMHTQAFCAYTIAQRFDPESTELAAAKAASLINLGMFSAALKDVHSVISQDPFNTGLILRKTHSLWGLGKYEETIDYLRFCFEKMLSSVGKNADEEQEKETIRKGMFIHNLATKTEKIIENNRSPEIMDSDAFTKDQVQICTSEPEYYGPISVISHNMDGNGDGDRKIVVTKKAVSAGTLLAKIRAFSFVLQNEGGETGDDDRNEELLNLTMQKLQLEKPADDALCDFLESQVSSCNSTGLWAALLKMCEKYSYKSCHHTAQVSKVTNNNGLSPCEPTIRGLWTFPANIRHACVGGNAVWYICGNFMFIRAINNIKKGEEVIMAHVEPTKPLEFRINFLKKKGTECECPLCQFEHAEPETTKLKRDGILKTACFKSLIEMNSLKDEVRRVKCHMADLEALQLRSAYAKLNFPIVDPLYNFGLCMIKIGNIDDAITAFKKAFCVVHNTAAIFTLVNLSFLLSYCYMVKKKANGKHKSKKWFNAMKSYEKLSYGCIAPVEQKFKTEFEYLERKGIAM